MASDYRTNSPSADYMSMGSIGPSSAYGGSQSGSDYGFDTPQHLPNGHGMGSLPTSSAHINGYTSAPATLPGGMQPFPNAFDTSMMPSPSVVQMGNGMSDGQSPSVGHHRLSVGSTGQHPGMVRHNSFAGSDTTSPDGQRGQAPFENQFSSENNGAASQNAGETGKSEETLGGAPPPWSELKTKAGKERKRLPLACIACRRKKIRCSGEKPACKHCLRSRIPCVYKVTTRKAAPRTDYMAMLDKRLKRMEERVIKCIPKDEQVVVNNTGRAVVKPPLLPPAPPKPANSKKRGADEAFGDELDEWFHAKGTAPVSRAEPADPKSDSDTDKAKDAEEHNLLLEGADKLPSKELQEHLAEVFFDYVYGQSYHLLHKPSFIRKLSQGTMPPVLMLAVCAMSARFSNHPAVRTEPAFLRGEDWASAARDIALRRYDTPNITILIVYLILGLHEFGTCQGGRSWMFGGMAQRMAYALQLHKDLDHDPKERAPSAKNGLTFTDREIRRRTMWSCFLMDRFNSSGTDRPIFVGEQYIRVQLPIKERYYQMEINGSTEDLDGNVPNPVEVGTGQMADAKENMGVAAYLVRLVAVWGRLVNYLNLGGKERDRHPMWSEDSKFWGIKKAAGEWKESLPPSLDFTPENLQNHASEKIANQFLFLHVVYNQVLLFMNRFALPSPDSRSAFPKEMPEEFIAEASKTAFEAANQISILVHEAMDHLLVAPFAGYAAFLSSTVHIHGAFSKNAQLEASSKQNLAWNVKYLTKMKKYWGMFHFVTENLRDLYRRRADVARSGAKAGKEGELAIFQYGDWFDRYPHGVSGTDYEEPSTQVKKEPGSDAVLGQKSDLQTVEEFFSNLSPPSRAAHLQQQQSMKRMSKKRKSTSDAGKAVQPPTSQPQQLDHNASQNGHHLPSAQVTHDLAANINDGFAQHSIAFPPGFQPPHNPLIMTPPQQYLSQLDRQMVLNSYSSNSNQAVNNMLDGSGALNFDNFDYNAFANNQGNAQQSNGFWGDPSTAWFMPFNMEPPTVGEDNNLFSGNLDWSNTFAGFGDMSGMGPSGLTPAGMENGQDGMGDQISAGMDGLDRMQ